jgi:hypothetical protein
VVQLQLGVRYVDVALVALVVLQRVNILAAGGGG